jgi:hypothetical protein
MRHLEVLVVTPQTTTSKILNWKVSNVSNVEIAIEKLQQRPYKVVAINKTIAAIDKTKFKQIATILNTDAIVVEYTDDNTLADTVKRAYWSTHTPQRERNYLDNAFEIKLANSINLN